MKVVKQEKERYLKSLGKQIKKAREGKDLTQEELAYKLDVHRTYIGRIERGLSNPPAYTLHKIKEVIGLN